MEELCGEKIDIVRWSDDPVELCGNALNPADILDITVDESAKSILVIVPHDQLSLAIGKRGQNARLASKLMGWNIDIKSDVELAGGPPQAAADAPVEGADTASEEADPTSAGDAPEKLSEELDTPESADADSAEEVPTNQEESAE